MVGRAMATAALILFGCATSEDVLGQLEGGAGAAGTSTGGTGTGGTGTGGTGTGGTSTGGTGTGGTGTGTGGVAGTGTGGTAVLDAGGILACGFPVGTEGCRTCAEAACCTAAQACADAPACISLVVCLQGCGSGSSGCTTTCNQQWGSGQQGWLAVAQCLLGSCASVCQ